MGIKKGASALWHSELSLHQLGSRPTVFMPRWTTHPCILYQVCATRGANSGCPLLKSGGGPIAPQLRPPEVQERELHRRMHPLLKHTHDAYTHERGRFVPVPPTMLMLMMVVINIDTERGGYLCPSQYRHRHHHRSRCLVLAKHKQVQPFDEYFTDCRWAY